MRTYLLYDCDICISECRASGEDTARRIFTERFGNLDFGPYYIECR